MNKQYNNGQTAFHNAVSQVDTKTVNLLLQYGAKVSIKNDLGLGALEFAILGGKYDILDTICKHLSYLPAEKVENAEAVEFFLTKEKEIETCLARAQSGSLTNLRSFFEKHCQNNNALKLLGKMGFDSSCQVIYQYSRDKKFAHNKDYTNTVHKLLGEFYQQRINLLM